MNQLLLSSYVQLFSCIQSKIGATGNRACLKKEYALLFNKILNDCVACIILTNGIPNTLTLPCAAAPEMIMRSINESVITLKYLIKYSTDPDKLEQYKDNAFIERLKDIAKSLQYGFYDDMDHTKLLDITEKIIKKRGPDLQREELLDFNKLRKISYFPDYRACVKDLKDDFTSSDFVGVYLTAYSIGSQLIHANPLSIVEHYFGEIIFADTLPFSGDSILQGTLHSLLVSSNDIDKLLVTTIDLANTEEFKELYRLLYPSTTIQNSEKISLQST
ncbi:MAG TPA: DUF5677 domain-containing protein [Coleofasciculaceae cyanobacterium]|jgi:hypothetical protein